VHCSIKHPAPFDFPVLAPQSPPAPPHQPQTISFPGLPGIRHVRSGRDSPNLPLQQTPLIFSFSAKLNKLSLVSFRRIMDQRNSSFFFLLFPSCSLPRFFHPLRWPPRPCACGAPGRHLRMTPSPFRKRPLFSPLSGFSPSLYLFHFFSIFLLTALISPLFEFPPECVSVACPPFEPFSLYSPSLFSSFSFLLAWTLLPARAASAGQIANTRGHAFNFWWFFRP